MALASKNWTLNSYTNSTWTDLVAEPAIVASVIISNTSVGNINVSLRMEDAAASLAVILPPAVIGPDESYTFDCRSLGITGTQALQIWADAAGAEFFASGAV